MLTLPEFAQMIEHNNELLSNEQKRNENMKDTLEKSKKSCKYTEKFKLKCDEIYKHFSISEPNERDVYNLNKDDLKEKDEIIKNYEDYNSKYEELGIVYQPNMIVNRYTNLPDFAIVINLLEDELNEIKNDNNKLQIEIVKNNDQYDLSIAFNELYFRICDYLNDKLYFGIIICGDCLKSYEPDFECEHMSNNDSDYGDSDDIDDTIAYYDDYCSNCSNCNTQPLCGYCWYKRLIGE
jgi:hypothetical protein